MAHFDSKAFNAQAFAYMVGRAPGVEQNELKKSRALAPNPDIQRVFADQDGAAYARIAMRGLADGDAVNYDGETDIGASSTKTFEQGIVVVGRAKAWEEKDFAFDLTGGVDFMENIANQVSDYKDGVDQATILAILEGIFSMSGEKNEEFVSAHTTDITGDGDGCVTATTLNSACNRACGANKKKFSIVFVHSDVATNLENMQLLEYLKQTDASGVTRDLSMATWNGKLLIVDDGLPVDRSGDAPVYTSYVLGDGAIGYEDVGAKVPYEMHRDPARNGGRDTLYMRQRKCFAPFGISYEKISQQSHSPTDEELKDGGNWALVHSGEADASQRSTINHKAIAIARILSKG